MQRPPSLDAQPGRCLTVMPVCGLRFACIRGSLPGVGPGVCPHRRGIYVPQSYALLSLRATSRACPGSPLRPAMRHARCHRTVTAHAVCRRFVMPSGYAHRRTHAEPPTGSAAFCSRSSPRFRSLHIVCAGDRERTQALRGPSSASNGRRAVGDRGRRGRQPTWRRRGRRRRRARAASRACSTSSTATPLASCGAKSDALLCQLATVCATPIAPTPSADVEADDLGRGLQWVDVPGCPGLILRPTYQDLALPGAFMDRPATGSARRMPAGTAPTRRARERPGAL